MIEKNQNVYKLSMNNKLTISAIVLLAVVCVYFVNINQQKSYQSSSSKLLITNQDQIKKMIIQSDVDALEIMNNGNKVWQISGHDSLSIKEDVLTNFFDKIFNLEIQNIMTEKEEKWGKFNVDDSTGTHLALIDWDDNTINYFVFGQSNSDYSRCYVRKDQNSTVYLLNESILYYLQTNPNYWGETIIKEDDLEIPTQ